MRVQPDCLEKKYQSGRPVYSVRQKKLLSTCLQLVEFCNLGNGFANPPRLFYSPKPITMAVRYILVERGNPQDKAAPKKFYAQAVSTGDTTLRTIKKDISDRSTVNSADVMAVLDTLVQMLIHELSQGKIVRFGDFGSFQLTLSSEGAESEDKFSSSMIRDSKITFRPGSDLRDMIATLKYEKG